MTLDLLLIQLVNGIVSGLILALVASGLTLIFGIMDVVNFAHGELFMLGAYVGTTVAVTTGNFWAALVGASSLWAIDAASASRAREVELYRRAFEDTRLQEGLLTANERVGP